jgi:co-chaperonin GroES (HSP10)
MTTTIRPVFDRIALETIKEKEQNGFVIAADGQKVANKARVVAVGPGHLDTDTGKYYPCSLKVGDVVLINPHLGMRGRVDKKEIIFQMEGEVLCVLESSEE